MTGATPEIVRSVAGLREQINEWRAGSAQIGLVPTMGALHAGHLALVRHCLEDCHRTVVSIFVNPTQFAPNEDFATYPRDEATDLAAIGTLGADLAYIPTVDEMYADGFATTVSVAGVSEGLCGAVRPHFFQGVATVVSKLLLQCRPDRAYFGEKDYQQLQVLRRMARDLDLPVTIVGVPTAREEDGLAMSSRNAYLSAAERAVAPMLHRIMTDVAGVVAGGAPVAEATRAGRARLAAAGFDPIDYFEFRDAERLEPVDATFNPAQPIRLFAAAYLGKTRLIDNIAVCAAD